MKNMRPEIKIKLANDIVQNLETTVLTHKYGQLRGGRRSSCWPKGKTDPHQEKFCAENMSQRKSELDTSESSYVAQGKSELTSISRKCI